MRLFRRGAAIPASISAAFSPDEHVLATAPTSDGAVLAATRYGLWADSGGVVRRIDWHLISRARLTAGTLLLTVAETEGQWPDGTVLLRDAPEVTVPMEQATKLTDIVHHRVRGSVAASRHLPWPGAGGWVVLRRVAGRDGLTTQVRLDADADPEADGFAAAIALTVDEIWPESVPRPTGPDILGD